MKPLRLTIATALLLCGVGGVLALSHHSRTAAVASGVGGVVLGLIGLMYATATDGPNTLSERDKYVLGVKGLWTGGIGLLSFALMMIEVNAAIAAAVPVIVGGVFLLAAVVGSLSYLSEWLNRSVSNNQ